MTKISERVKIIVDNESVTIAKFSQNLGYERSQTIHDIVLMMGINELEMLMLLLSNCD